MGKATYLGVDNKARKVKKAYIGVGGKARKIKKMYIGVDGKARLFFSSGGNNPLIFIYHNTGNANEQNVFTSSGDDMRTATLTKNALAQWALNPIKGAPYIVGDRYFHIGDFGTTSATYQYSDNGITWTKKTVSIVPSWTTSAQSYFYKATYMGDGKFAFGLLDTATSSKYIQGVGIFDVNSGAVSYTKVLETTSNSLARAQRMHTIVKYDDQTYYLFVGTKVSSSSITMNVYRWNGSTTVTKLSAEIGAMYSEHNLIYSMIHMGDYILFTTYQSRKYVYAFSLKDGTITQLADVGNCDTFLVKISDTEFMAIYCYSNRQFRRYTFNGSTMTLVSNYTQTTTGYHASTLYNYVCRDGVLYFVEVDNPGNNYARYYLMYSTDFGKTWTKKTLYDSTNYRVPTTSDSKLGLIWNGLESEVNDSTYGMIH